LHHINPPIPFTLILPPPTGSSPPKQDLFHLPALWFCKWKKLSFFLFNIVTQGVSLWHFHVSMCHKPN
jgi:hypothetical protein